jgi:hypothetical protein
LKLGAVTCLFNLAGQRMRWHAYLRFLEAFPVVTPLVVVELGGDDPFGSYQDSRKTRIHLRQDPRHRLFLKENLMNIGHKYLPSDCDAVAFLDADILFLRPDWVEATCKALETHKVVQMFSQAIDLDASGQAENIHLSHEHHRETWALGSKNHHPGLAWAWRRETLEAMGGLLDIDIGGSGDLQMAAALHGHVVTARPPGMHPEYNAALDAWQAKADQHVAGNVGCVPGAVAHIWHGPKSARGYDTRWGILKKHQFQPADLVRNEDGMYQLRDPQSELARDLKAHFG